MKKQQKLKFLLFFFLSIIIVSCAYEEDLIKNQVHQENVKVEFKKYNDLLKNSNFTSAFKKIPSKKALKIDINGRSVIEDQYGFTIINNTVKVVQEGNKTFYTLQIETDNNTDNKIENLVLNSDINSNDVGYILKYNSDNSNNLTEQQVKQAGLKSVEPLTDSSESKFLIVTFVYSLCDGIPYDCHGDECGFDIGQMTIWVPEMGGGSSSSGTVPNSGNPGTGSSGWNPGSTGGGTPENNNGNNPLSPNGYNETHVPTSPLINEVQDSHTAPCAKVKKQFVDNPTLKDNLQALEAKKTDTIEHGKYKLHNAVIQTPPNGIHGEVAFPPNPSGKFTMIAHTHNSPASSTLSVFSWYDLEALAAYMKLGKIDDSFTAFLMTADGTRYAFTIDNKEDFLKFFAFDGESNYDPAIGLKRSKAIRKYYNLFNDPNITSLIDLTNSNIDNEKAFLQMMQDNTMGLSLFEVNADYTNFEKLNFDKNTNNITKQPCL